MSLLQQRVDEDELMDDPNIGYEEFSQTLKQLERLNHLISSYRPTIQTISFFWKKKHQDRTLLKILDIGCGYGDMLRQIHRWATARNIPVELTGLDLNPWSEQAARLATPQSMNIHYLTANIFDFKPRENYHLIINSLFTHHLKDESIVNVLRWMTDHAVDGWFVNDLHRHVIPYYFIKYFVKIFRFNRLIKNDAPLSVARAFTRKDWEQLIIRANLDRKKIQVKWHWPFRYGVRYEA